MARINLLPWRDNYRLEKKKEFITILVVVLIAAVASAFLWVKVVDSKVEYQDARNKLLKDEIRVLDKQVAEIRKMKKQKEDLLARRDVIQGLQGKRPVIVRYFDEMARAVPDGLFLNSLKRSGNRIDITGVAESPNRVSSFMRNLDDSEWFNDANLSAVKKVPAYGEQATEFTLTVRTAAPASDKDAEEGDS